MRFSRLHRPLRKFRRPSVPTLRAAVLLPVRIDQLREERRQILVPVPLLQGARGAGRGVEVYDLSGTEDGKVHEVEHDDPRENPPG